MGQAAALSGLIGLTGPLAIVLKPPPVTWLGLISANIGYFIYAPFLRVYVSLDMECIPRAENPAALYIDREWGCDGKGQIPAWKTPTEKRANLDDLFDSDRISVG